MEINSEKLSEYLSSHGLTLVKSTWYTSLHGSFGIITVQSKYEQSVKHYLGRQIWDEEEEDVLDILEHGARFYPEAFAQFIL